VRLGFDTGRSTLCPPVEETTKFSLVDSTEVLLCIDKGDVGNCCGGSCDHASRTDSLESGGGGGNDAMRDSRRDPGLN
jgi:hypothetical protein